MKRCQVVGLIAIVSLLIQACGNRQYSNKMRIFDLPSGGRITVERMTSSGQEGEQVTEYGRDNNLIGVSWCPGGSYDGLTSLFGRLKKALVSNSQQSVADVMDFPLVVNGGEKSVVIHDRAEFSRRYHAVFTSNVLKAIAEASPQSIFCTGDGASFANGVVWTRHWKAVEVVNQ